MKKKRNFLTIISSILGVLTICSFSIFSIFSRSEKKANSVGAITSVVIQEKTRNASTSYFSQSSEEVTINYNAIGQFIKIFDGPNISYGVSYRISFNFQFSYLNNYYRVFNGTLGNDFTLSYIHYLEDSLEYDEFEYSGFIRYVDFYQSPDRNQHLKMCMYSRVYQLLSGVDNLAESQFIFDGVGSPAVFLNNNVVDFRLESMSSPLDNLGRFLEIDLTYIHDEMIYIHNTPEDTAFDEGYTSGYSDGYNQGNNDGSLQGYSNGYDVGYQVGLTEGQSQVQQSYSDGYNAGYNDGFNADSTAITIMSGIFQVALVPINFFLGIFNFKILGINLSSFIQTIFTIVITIIILKSVFGNKGD